MGSQFLEKNYRIDRFRYFTSGINGDIDKTYEVPALVQYPNAKWNASIPGYISSLQPEAHYKSCDGPDTEDLKCCGVTKDGKGVPCITVHEVWSAVRASSSESVTITSEFSDFQRILKYTDSEDKDKVIVGADM